MIYQNKFNKKKARTNATINKMTRASLFSFSVKIKSSSMAIAIRANDMYVAAVVWKMRLIARAAIRIRRPIGFGIRITSFLNVCILLIVDYGKDELKECRSRKKSTPYLKVTEAYLLV